MNQDYLYKNTDHYYRLYIIASQKNKEYLISIYPEYQDKISRFNNKYINWLALRFGQDPKIQELHPIGDCLKTLLTYQNKDSAISQKYTQNEEFKNKIDSEFPIDQRKWTNPADSLLMTVDEMEKILVIFSKPKSKNTVEGLIEDTTDKSYKLPTEDLIGKVGPWNIWLPTSRENSCKIAGYDPVSLKPYTTWCTARTEGSNLFYNYVGAGTILYYLIKDNPSNDDDWLSVGFMEGQPVFHGNGGISVNRANKGLTKDSLSSILGGNYDAIMEILQGKTNSLEGKSPAYIKIEEAANDINKYHALIRGNTKEEAEALKFKVTEITTNQEILSELINEEDSYFKYDAIKKITNEEILSQLANDEDEFVRRAVAATTTNNETLKKLILDSSLNVSMLAYNRLKIKNIPEDLLIKFIYHVRSSENDDWTDAMSDIFEDIRKIGKKKIIEDIALNKEDHGFSELAIYQQIDNVEVLQEIMQNPEYGEYVRSAAGRKLYTINEEIERQKKEHEKYLQLLLEIKKITDQKKLQEIAETYPTYKYKSKEVRLAAIKQIRDIEILKEIYWSLGGEFSDIIGDRIEKLDNPQPKIANLSKTVNLFYKIVQAISKSS